MRQLSQQRVLILGWGHIPRRLAALLAPFEFRVTAVRCGLSWGDGPVRVVTAEALDAELANADHL